MRTNKQRSSLVILAASKKVQDYVTVFNTVPSLIPFNGRPLIYQIILNFIEKFDGPIFIALPKGEERIEKFLNGTFAKRAQIFYNYIESAKPNEQSKTLKSILNLMARIEDCPNRAIIANGDVYFELPEELPAGEKVAYVTDYVTNDKYSSFTRDDSGVHFLEIGRSAEAAKEKFIDCGVYSIENWGNLLKENFNGKGSVGKLLTELYSKDLRLEVIDNWVDLGHVDSSAKISTKILGTRVFNTIKVDEKKGLLTKSSSKQFKILQEINYYLKLPKVLSIYFPRLYDFDLGKKASYSIEYYPYKTLSEYFVMYEIPLETWEVIFKKIVNVYQDFLNITLKNPPKEYVEKIYLEKLFDRISAVPKNTKLWSTLNEKYIEVNGEKLKGWESFLPLIKKVVAELSENPSNSVIHGDLCFSNILYDPPSGVIKFIDPRGEFYEEGIYGDFHYDWAKFLHSVDGGYDFIIHRMYSLEEGAPNTFNFELFQTENVKKVKTIFISVLNEMFSETEIKRLLVLEAMLFLSMLPLHGDDPDRQLAFYITALKTLKKATEFGNLE